MGLLMIGRECDFSRLFDDGTYTIFQCKRCHRIDKTCGDSSAPTRMCRATPEEVTKYDADQAAEQAELEAEKAKPEQHSSGMPLK